jgi:hypothetical protein
MNTKFKSKRLQKKDHLRDLSIDMHLERSRTLVVDWIQLMQEWQAIRNTVKNGLHKGRKFLD